MRNTEDRQHTIEQLHRKYGGILYDLCVRILKDRSEAEDAVQETFLNAFRALDTFSHGASHLPWLYRIATNVCLKILRTASRKGAVLEERIERFGAETMDPTDALYARKVLGTLANQLDDRSMRILIAHFFGGMNQEEIAQMLNISRRAVVKRLARLRQTGTAMKEDFHD